MTSINPYSKDISVLIYVLETIINAIWLMMPAYTFNMCAVLFGGGTPIDLGRKFMDGKRILGDGKTYRGSTGGIFGGIAMGVGQGTIAPNLGLSCFTIPALICLSFGAMAGDVAKSLLKRRVGLERGAPLPLVDQLDFVFGALIVTAIFCYEWFIKNFTPWIIITIIVLTPILHKLFNIIGYKIGKKEVPW